MPKFKTVKRKKECEFCHKKFKSLKIHQKFCKQAPNNLKTYSHIPLHRDAYMSLEDRLKEERLKGYEHGCKVGEENSHNEYRKGLEDMKDFVKYLLEKR